MGTTSNHHAPYDPGYTRTTMAINRGKQSCEAEQNPKNGPSSDCRLQLAYMKVELLVIANQNVESAAEGRIGDWGEVVTR